MEGTFFIVAALWLVMAVVGAMIASNNGANGGAGFLLGLLLGPIGLIIAALLKPNVVSNNIRPFEGPRSLDNDSYRLWLASGFDIQRNDVFNKFTCKGQLFDTLDEALTYADRRYEENIVKYNLPSAG